jgi:serine/threonine protein kinase
MRGLLNAVRHLHKHGFMHRDIKLSNVAWDQRTQQPILLDFDLVYNFSQKFPTRYAGTQGRIIIFLLFLRIIYNGNYL